MATPYIAFWFRRDLRLEDNIGLWHALNDGRPVIPVFIFDREILDQLPAKDARVTFIHQQITRLQQQLSTGGSSLVVEYGNPASVWEKLSEKYDFQAVFTNHDYEPYAQKRDNEIAAKLLERRITFQTFKDQVIFEKKEILSQSDTPYTVFTPYSRKWKDNLNPDNLRSFDTAPHFHRFWKTEILPVPTLEEMRFEPSDIPFPGQIPDPEIIKNYDKTRDFPGISGTSRLGIHLRFGTLSVRELVKIALKSNPVYLNELIWREFYMQILWNFPHVAYGPFKKNYEAIHWREDPDALQRWKEGKTGYPLVDAGMRELNSTGYMHNRVRMVVASFLSKHLLINWQHGEAYFAEKLLDFELSSNNGGWQWAAGCGTDAAPYFRIFNPESQLKKFDPQAKYIRKWVPEFGTPSYPRPMVEHTFARERCLEAYKKALADN
ncbi:MAG: deoxyribodipyrimidine photo-lyase [Bacteroidia bacterium]|nr:deoxyribodipyrimidine photo-lyase [Bacteroidia bacterium]